LPIERLLLHQKHAEVLKMTMRLFSCAYILFAGYAASAIAQQTNSPPESKPAATRAPATPNPQKMDVLRQLSTSFEEISQRSGRAVVQIFVRSYVSPASSDTSGALLTAENSSGSGILMSPDGYILTNAHVVKNAHSVKVQLNVRAEVEARELGDRSMNRPIAGTLIGIDRDSDLAVVKIDKNNLPYLPFGDSNELKQGQIVLALGNPLGLDNSVSLGVVSAVARQVKPDDAMVYIQTDAPINPGNSGGPLVDSEGRVVGINTFILTQSGGSEGIGFAIPSNIAREVYAQLKEHGHVHRARLGITAETITGPMAEGLELETDHGIIVSDLEPNGPAEHAGIQVDDIIIALNNKRITTKHELEANVFRMRPGTKVTLRVQRGEGQLDLPVITEEEAGEELDALADTVDPVKNVVPELGIVGLDITKAVHELMPDQNLLEARFFMALIRWEPVRELGTIQNEMNRLFNTFFDAPTPGNGGTLRRWVPAMDLVETETDFVLKADLPGMSEADVNIELEDNVLTISGERKAEHEERKAGYYRVERSFGSFRRSLTLPEGTDPASVKATFDRGVLEVTVPKPAQKTPRKVQISVGGGAEASGQSAIEGSETGQPAGEAATA
jgi:serine protease Do